MKIGILDISVVVLILFFLISSLVSIDRWASFAGSFLVWRDGFFVFFLLVAWYFFGARIVKLDSLWRFGFILPILFMFFLGILTNSFAVAFLGLSALLFFHIVRKLKSKERPLWQGSEILLIAILIAMLGLFGAFPISSFLLLHESSLDSWNIAVSSVGSSLKNFLLGTGPGTFSLDVAQYGVESSVKGTGLAEILATFGVLGFSLYILLFALVFFRFALLVFTKNDRTQAFLASSTIALFGSYLLSLATLPLAFLFWTLASLARQQTHIIPTILKPLWKLGVIIIAGFVSLWGFRVFAGEIVYQKATTERNVASRAALLETAGKLNPYEIAYKIELGKLYLNQAKQESQGDTSSPQATIALENALVNLRQATIANPARPEAWEALGMLYKEIQGAPGAKEWGVKAFETALKLSPKNPRLYTELGMLYAQKEEFLLAEEQFKKALSLSPNFLDGLMALALLEEKKGNTDLALSILEKLSSQNPSHMASLFQLGRIYYNKGMMGDAERTFKRVLLLNPNDSNAHYALGLLYEKTKRVKEAIQEFQKVLELNPDNQILKQKVEQLSKYY